MAKMKEIGVAVLGFGTVGAGVVETLQKNGALLAERLGLRLVLRGVADLDLVRDRGVAIDRSLLTADAAALIARPDVDVVVELIGGTGAAKQLVLQTLRLGKPVVTANKKLLAEHGEEIHRVAEEHHTAILFEASVGGGIPIIKALREGLCANRIESIYGILNGTCNYILTRMEEEHLPFDEVLKAAQAAGYGAQWLTGWASYDTMIRERLVVAEDEAIVGFIHIGSAAMEAPERDRPDAETLLSDWTP